MGALRLGSATTFIVCLGACTTFGEAPPADAGAGTDATSGAVGCDTAGCPLLCSSLHTSRPELLSGFYELDPDGSGQRPARKVYCDMEKEGGGWTLVARSVDKIKLKTDFGWRHDHGEADDDSVPYSLALNVLGVAPRELLFGAYSTGKTWADPIYRHALPAGFMDDYRTTPYEPPGGATTVSGTCKPANGPTFLRLIGRTDLDDHFFFGDQPDDGGASFGLFSAGWNSNYGFLTGNQRCENGALLGDKQAMIFVR